MIPRWLEWARQLQATAQNGLAYSQNPFDIERFHQVRQVAAEIMAAHTGRQTDVVTGIFENETGYATPKLDARGVVFKKGRILLVKELADGGWTLPGGWVDVNETPSQSVEREVLEESGYQVKARKLLALYDRNLHGHPPYMFHIYKMFFLCDLLGGEGTTSAETGGADFFAPNNLPPLSTPRTTREEIERFFIHLKNPDLPTDFD